MSVRRSVKLRVHLRGRREMGVDITQPQAVQRDALHLFTADWAIEPPRPIVPNVKYVGGVLVGPSAPLPPDLEVTNRHAWPWVPGS